MQRRRLLTFAGAMAVVGMLVGPAVAPAGAGQRSGHQSFQITINEVSPTGTPQGIGPIHADGVIDGKGMDQEVAPAPTDPPNANRDVLTFRQGTLTVLTTGGNSGAPKIDGDCNVSFRITNLQTSVVGGTGAYANASGRFTDTLRIEGVLPRNPDGTCNQNQNTNPLFDTVHVNAEGHLKI